MNKIYKLLLTLVVGLLIVSCNKSDGPSITPKRDYAEQYAKDNDSIVKFLQTHYMEVVDDTSLPNYGDVSFTEIPTGGTQTSIWNETDEHRKLRTRLVDQDNIVYTVYYISFRDGVGVKPCNVDGVYTNYKGTLLNGNVFDQATNPQQLQLLEGVIRGWSEVFPQFASGTYSANGDGTISYADFGAGVMFVPSGLAYYNNPRIATVPAYSPLIFNFKLYEVKRMDQDGDGIPSYLEDLNGDGYIYSLGKDEAGVNIPNPDNTDGDVTLFPNGDVSPDYLDLDDDADHVLTKTEITQYTNPVTGAKHYYSYDGAAVDDPLTPYDETQGVPSCGTTPDYTTPGRLRKYRDPSCH